MSTSVAERAEAVRSGDRRALATAITLVESTRPEHREQAAALLDLLLDHTRSALRIGVSGPPGAGKSTLIEALGTHLVDHDRRVAVLAVDPSSTRSGGSILGDKTRMETLSRSPSAFVRPSPSSGQLGGVAPRTREVILLCEAAGFDTVVVETVGVGQSEVQVDHMVDLFVLVVPPAGGDELQGIKRGVTELADVLVVNKADGDLQPAAARAAMAYGSALHLVEPKHPGRIPPVLQCSALSGAGIDELWRTLSDLAGDLDASGALAHRRREQWRRWLWEEIATGLDAAFRADPQVAAALPDLEQAVVDGTTSAPAAATQLLRGFLPG